MRALGLLALACLPAMAATPSSPSPYAGQQQRAIKSLSASDIEGYRQGNGMGFAKAAELNRYPGPRHVLDLAAPLALTPAQRRQSQDIHDRMHRDAVRLGRQFVEREAALNRLFAGRTADHNKVERLTREIALLQAQLRFVHLRAHLEMATVLTPGQIDAYDRLRGYRSGHRGGHLHRH